MSGTSHKAERIQPHFGQTRKAVSNTKETLIQSASIELRTNMSKRPTSPGGAVHMPVATKATLARGKSAAAGGAKSNSKSGKTIRVGSSSNTKKTSTSKASRSALVPPSNPRDTRIIQWVGNKWNALETHHQQRIFSTCLLLLSLLLFGSV